MRNRLTRPVFAGGVDLVDIDRLQLAITRTGPPLVHRLFDADERDACADGADPIATAVLFGIKESVVKLAGGMPVGGRYRDVHGSRAARRTGPVRLSGAFHRWAERSRVDVLAAGERISEQLVLCRAVAILRGVNVT